MGFHDRETVEGLLAAFDEHLSRTRGGCPGTRRNTALHAPAGPIVTGVIGGACTHPVKGRMGLTGARWSPQVAEAAPKLRALHANSDFPDY